MPCLGADCENTQCLFAERRQRRHLFEKCDVVFETHGYGKVMAGDSGCFTVRLPKSGRRQS